jgi:hypothetical protein
MQTYTSVRRDADEETERGPSVLDRVITPEDYREARPGIDGFRLLRAHVTLMLLDDPRVARYEYECELETTGPAPARNWCYHVPANGGEVCDPRAWDARGKLSERLCVDDDGPGTRLEVRLRDEVRTGERYSFGFGYETGIRPLVVEDGRRRIVSVADWVIFNIPCRRLDVLVELPGGSEPVQIVPAADDQGGRIAYRKRAVRPLETMSYTVGYRSTLRRRPAYRRVVDAAATAVLGGASLH